MEIVKPGILIDFMAKRKIAFSASLLLILIGVGAMIYNKATTGKLFNYGVDFAGGTLIQLRFENPANLDKLRAILKDAGLKDVMIQDFGSPREVLIRTQKSSGSLSGLQEKVADTIKKGYADNKFEVRRVEVVGPKVGRELKEKGLLAIIYALLGILIYVSWRFEFKFAVGAVLALFHDVTITAGIFALLHKQMDLQILAALLTIVGYSLNDTIVVYDRIRENHPSGMMTSKRMIEIINRSVSETLSRTLLTSLTTLVAVLALLFLGGEVIRGFALALTIGIVVGTYSSIFIASPVVVYWYQWDLNKLIPFSKKG